MAKFTNPLDNIKVASPCSADWNQMLGNERKRYCGDCKLNVYNLSGMTRAEAENLLANSEGRLCVRFYRRQDGTVLTDDCPVGWQAIKRRVSKMAAAFVALIFGVIGGLGFSSALNTTNNGKKTRFLPVWITPTPPVIMGNIAMPTPTPKKQPTPKQTGQWEVGEKSAPDMGRIAVR